MALTSISVSEEISALGHSSASLAYALIHIILKVKVVGVALRHVLARNQAVLCRENKLGRSGDR